MALAIDYTADDRRAWRDCIDYLRSQITARAADRRPHKLACRRGEYDQQTLWRERCAIRGTYLLYGLLRGRPIDRIESGRASIPTWMNYWIALQWHAMVAAGHAVPIPTIASLGDLL